MTPIPKHLTKYNWYAPHLAWLKSEGVDPIHDPGDAEPVRADLRGADLCKADLCKADLCKADLGWANLRRADLRWADLRGADLRWADLSDSYLRWADLSDSYLRWANLRDADLEGATGLPVAPIVPDIDKQIYEQVTNGGTLEMRNWHTCDTTHCRAGWAIHLAGEPGYELENKTSPYIAGRLIYEASRPGVPAPDFFEKNEEALEDLKRCADG